MRYHSLSTIHTLLEELMILQENTRILFEGLTITAFCLEVYRERLRGSSPLAILSSRTAEDGVLERTALRVILCAGTPLTIHSRGLLDLRASLRTFFRPEESSFEKPVAFGLRLVPERGQIESIELHEEPRIPTEVQINNKRRLVMDVENGSHRLEIFFGPPPPRSALSEITPPKRFSTAPKYPFPKPASIAA